MPAVQSTLVPLPSNLMDINDTNDGLDVCERVTLLIIIVSAVCGALLSLVLVLLLCCIVALTRKRVRQRNVRLAGSVRRIAPYPARRVALPGMFHLQSNVCYGNNSLLVRNGDIGVSSQQFSPCNVSLNPSCFMSASPTTDSKSPTHQYDDVMNFPQKDEDPTEVYDTLHPKSKDKDPSSDHDYENTTEIHNACFSPSQATINTLLLPITLTHPQATAPARLSTLSEEDYVNEFDGPFTPLSMTHLSRPPPASLLKRHCTTSSTSPSHLSRPHASPHFSGPHTPRDYEVPLTTRRLKKNFTMKW